MIETKLSYLLDEYKYRHDLVWRVLFRITFIVILLSYLPYAPYLQGSLAEAFGSRILILPVLAVFLAGFGIKVLNNELDLFWRAVVPYHLLQKQFFEKTFPGRDDVKSFDPIKEDRFFPFVRFFVWALLGLSLVNLLFLAWYIPWMLPLHPKTTAV